MNVLPGTIREIQTHGNLTLVTVDVSDIVFTSIVIETPETASYLEPGTPIKVMFKETEVIIGKNGAEISLRNQIPVQVREIKEGKLLSQLILQYKNHRFSSIITTNAVNQLQLKPGSEVLAMIKTNEIMLSE